jgi:flagellar motor switch protein FliN/FliY
MPTRLVELFGVSTVKEIAGQGGAPAAAQGGGDAAAAGFVAPAQPEPQQDMGFGQALGGMAMGGAGGPTPSVQPVQFASLQGGHAGAEQGNIGLLMDVFMEMTVELGRTRKLVKDILTIGEGSIIELDKLAGEPVDILVNHKLIAKGEVVVIDENFGVRVTEIVSPMERMGELNP